MKRSSSILNILRIIRASFIVQPINILVSILVARSLGPSDRGGYAFIQVLVALLLPTFSLGLSSSFPYLLNYKKYKPREIICSVYIISLGFSVLLLFAIFMICKFEIFYSENIDLIKQNLFLICFWVPFYVSMTWVERILIGDSKYNICNRLQIFRTILIGGLLIYLVCFLNMKIKGALFSLLTCAIIMNFLYGFIVFKDYGIDLKFRMEFVKDGLSYGIKSWIGFISNRANARLDQLILGLYTTTDNLGIYAVAANLSEIVFTISNSVGVVLLNKISSGEDDKKRTEIIARTHRLMVFYMFFLVVVICIVGWYLIPIIYGVEYKLAKNVMLIYLPGVLFYVPTTVISKYFSGIGKVGKNSIVQFIAFFISIPLLMLFIPKYGIYGAALGSSICYLVSSIAILKIYRKYIFPQKAILFKFERSEILSLVKVVFNKG